MSSEQIQKINELCKANETSFIELCNLQLQSSQIQSKMISVLRDIQIQNCRLFINLAGRKIPISSSSSSSSSSASEIEETAIPMKLEADNKDNKPTVVRSYQSTAFSTLAKPVMKPGVPLAHPKSYEKPRTIRHKQTSRANKKESPE